MSKADLVYTLGLNGPCISIHFGGYRKSATGFNPIVVGIFNLKDGEDKLGFE